MGIITLEPAEFRLPTNCLANGLVMNGGVVGDDRKDSLKVARDLGI